MLMEITNMILIGQVYKNGVANFCAQSYNTLFSQDVLQFCVDGYSWIYRSARKCHSHFPPSVNVYESTLARLLSKSKCLENLSPFLCNLLFFSLQSCINDPFLARLQFESSASTVYFDMKITIKNCQPFKKSIVSSSFLSYVFVLASWFFFYLKYYLFAQILFLGEMPKSFDLTLMNDKNDNSLFSLSIFW